MRNGTCLRLAVGLTVLAWSLATAPVEAQVVAGPGEQEQIEAALPAALKALEELRGASLGDGAAGVVLRQRDGASGMLGGSRLPMSCQIVASCLDCSPDLSAQCYLT